MQLPETPPPPLAPLWDRVLRARALPPDLDVEHLYVAIRDRLTHPEWEVRLHALRVLADLLPLSGNALAFPFDQVVDNLGHGSPNVRKAALDALKVFCTHCEDAECAARAILDKCYYHNIRPHSAGIDVKMNVITGLILSIPSVMGILKRRNQSLDLFPVFQILGEKLFDPVHRDVAHRGMMKLRKVCGHKEYSISLAKLDLKIQEKYRLLCENYDEDSLDVYFAPRKTVYQNNNSQPLIKVNRLLNHQMTAPMDSSSDESYGHYPYYNNNFAKVIIETEIKFDSDTAITMTVLEETESESERQTGSEDGYDSSDQNMLKFSDGDSEDTDVVVKRVRFGGESVKIRTPDSDNLITSEDDNHNMLVQTDNSEESIPIRPLTVNKMNDIKREEIDKQFLNNNHHHNSPTLIPQHNNMNKKKSGIPLPVILNKSHKLEHLSKCNRVKLKSKSLSELYDYFRSKNGEPYGKSKEFSGFELTISEVRSPQVSSPVEPHREVEVLHNLQRSPVVSPRRHVTKVQLDQDEFVLNMLATSPPPREDLRSPRAPTPLRAHYDWEELGVVPRHITDQLHNTENWIAVVKATDLLHSALLDANNVRKVEPAALSLVKHMWALSDEVTAAKAPAEGAVCALIRAASSDCARQLLPSLVSRMAREPLPAALPHALLQRLALHHLVDLIFDPSMIGETGDAESLQSAQLRATLCLARAAGPASVLSAVRRRLAGTARADVFCNKLRERLSRPLENIKPSFMARSSQLPVPVRRRARSTPAPAAPAPPRRLRPLPDSAPLPIISQLQREYLVKHLSPIPLSDRDSSVPAEYDQTDSNFIEEETKKSDIRPDDDARVLAKESLPADIPAQESPQPSPRRSPSLHRSPSICVEDYSERSNRSLVSVGASGESPTKNEASSSGNFASHKSEASGRSGISGQRSPGGDSSGESVRSTVTVGARDNTGSPHSSGHASPAAVASPAASAPPPPLVESPGRAARGSRDVRTALAECILPARHEDWEAILSGLVEMERLASDETARAPAGSWRAAARGTAAHVRSLRSRVARAACRTLGALYEHRGRALEPEVEESAAALLERCADANRFLRADASAALAQVACGGGCARAAGALCRRGAGHRAGPVRAAAAAALARLVATEGAARALALPAEARAQLLRAAGELLADASAEARQHARSLCLVLAEDARFQPMLKEAMTPSRYRSVEKLVDKLRYR